MKSALEQVGGILRILIPKFFSEYNSVPIENSTEWNEEEKIIFVTRFDNDEIDFKHFEQKTIQVLKQLRVIWGSDFEYFKADVEESLRKIFDDYIEQASKFEEIDHYKLRITFECWAHDALKKDPEYDEELLLEYLHLKLASAIVGQINLIRHTESCFRCPTCNRLVHIEEAKCRNCGRNFL